MHRCGSREDSRISAAEQAYARALDSHLRSIQEWGMTCGAKPGYAIGV